MRDQAGPNGIQFNVPVAREQVPLSIDRRRAISPFPQRARATVFAVKVRHVTSSYGLHDSRDPTFIVWSHQEMHVVRHQHIRVNLTVVMMAGVREAVTEDETIVVGVENRATIVAALDYVRGLFRDEEPRLTRHWESSRLRESGRLTGDR